MYSDPLTVLLVEENATDAEVLAAYVRAGAEPEPKVHLVTDVTGAEPALQNSEVSLVLLTLPRHSSANGSVVSQLRAVNADVPIIVLADAANRAAAIRAVKEGGAQEYLIKEELSQPLLERTMRYCVAQRQIRQMQQNAQHDLHRQRQLFRLITTISATFIHLPPEQTDQAIVQSLRSLAQWAGADQAFFCELPGESAAPASYEWAASGRPDFQWADLVTSAEFDWIQTAIRTRGAVVVNHLDELPSGSVRAAWRVPGIQSFVVTGLFHRKQIIGLLGVASGQSLGRREWWNPDTVSLISTSGEVFYRAIQKKQADEKLTESERKYRTLVEHIDEGLIQIDRQGKIQFINQSVYNMLGYSHAEMVGNKSIEDIFHEEYQEKNVLQMMRENSQSHAIEHYEVPVKSKTGEKIWVIINKHPIVDERGNRTGVMGTLVDITDRKRAEDQLRQVNEELKTFIYRASHDLRGPLATVLGVTSLARMETDDSVSLRYFDYIGQSTQKLDRTLKALMDISAITQPDEVYTYVQFDELIREVIDQMHYTNSLNDLLIQVKVNQPYSFISSKQLLMYLFEKLIENAVAYRKETISDSQLAIDVVVANGTARIDVVDNGIGIPKENQQKVFTMFFKGIEKSNGSGLGLYIVDKLVSKLNGRITLSSEIGVGTHFTIQLNSF